jgi:hypothetical protein
MAANISAYMDDVRSVTMDANPGDATAITLSDDCRIVSFMMLQADDSTADTAKYTFTGTDSAAIGTHAIPVVAGDLVEIELKKTRGSSTGSKVIYISAGTASALCKIHQGW